MKKIMAAIAVAMLSNVASAQYQPQCYYVPTSAPGGWVLVCR